MDADDPELMIAKSLTDKEIGVLLQYNAVHARTDIMCAIMIEAANRLGGGTETQYVDRPPPLKPPLKAFVTQSSENCCS
jgi:hypothetical protein